MVVSRHQDLVVRLQARLRVAGVPALSSSDGIACLATARNDVALACGCARLCDASSCANAARLREHVLAGIGMARRTVPNVMRAAF